MITNVRCFWEESGRILMVNREKRSGPAMFLRGRR